MTVTYTPNVDDLTSVVDQVWDTFIGTEQPLLPGPEALPDDWTAVVTIDGDWCGSVAVGLTDHVARVVTAGMLGMSADDDDMSEEDVADAVGELINVIGGNVKSLIGGSSRLSLPVVATGHFVRPGDAVEIGRVDRTLESEPISLLVHAFEGDAS